MFVKIYCMIVLVILFSLNSFGQALTPTEANLLSFDDCIHEDSINFDPENANWAVISTMCDFCFVHGQRPLVITSIHRPEGSDRSQHKFGNATDSHCSYDGLIGECAVWEQYLKDTYGLLEWVTHIGMEDETGIGIYNWKHGRLIHHLDFRGRKSRWGFTSDGQVSYDIARYSVIEKVSEVCD